MFLILHIKGARLRVGPELEVPGYGCEVKRCYNVSFLFIFVLSVLSTMITLAEKNKVTSI